MNLTGDQNEMKSARHLLFGLLFFWVFGSAVAQSTVLRFSWWGGSDRHARTLKVIESFERANPGIKIKAEYMGNAGYMEKLTMQMVGGTEPDIMQIHWASLAMFSKAGNGFYDLNQQKGVLSLDQFSADDLRAGSVQGKLNGLPTSFAARMFLWNRAAFKRAGLPIPSTWEELFEASRHFQMRIGSQSYPIDGELYDMILLSHAYALQAHGLAYIHPTEHKVAMDLPAAESWVRAYQRLTDSGAATPLPLRASLGGAEKPLEQQQDWVVGNWAGNYTWDTTIRLRQSTLDKNQSLDVGPFLMLPGAKASGVFGRPTMLLAVSKGTKHPEMAAKFLNYVVASPEAARLLSVTRGVPAASGARAALEADRLIPPLEHKAFLQIQKQRESGQIDRPSPRFEDARMRRLMRDVFEAVSYKKITAEVAAQRLIDDGNALLKRIK